MLPATRFLYFENSVGRLWEEPEGYLRLEYKAGPRGEAEFRVLLTHAAHVLSRHRWSNILVDQRQMAPFNPAEQAWMGSEWLIKAVHEHGYRKGAVLIAQNVFARLAMTQLMLGARNLPHTYRSFDDESAALTWLLSAG